MSPLHLAIEQSNYYIMQMLLFHQAEVNAKDRNERTTLHWAVLAKDPLILITLLEYGAHVNVRDVDGQTPLSWAFDLGNKRAVNILRAKGGEL